MRYQVKLTKSEEGVAVFHVLDYQDVDHRVQQKKKLWKTFRMLFRAIYQ